MIIIGEKINGSIPSVAKAINIFYKFGQKSYRFITKTIIELACMYVFYHQHTGGKQK